ncbi:MAG: cupin domain-containing protein [Deltaproteobacteria bacterium]|nr:MAG: cupin domain-containing protein [Deltaproteobacteria bacterium]
MKITEVEFAPSLENPHGVEVKKLYDTDNAQVMHIALEPGEQLHRHITPVDVFFYVLQGTGVIEIGDEKKSVGVDTLIDSPANIPHCWYNESNETLRILVSKVPRPTKSTRIL